jgi:hypothetical protein
MALPFMFRAPIPSFNQPLGYPPNCKESRHIFRKETEGDDIKENLILYFKQFQIISVGRKNVNSADTLVASP